MPTPNFIIAGAPKCGTTALYRYLSDHPDVYMPREKEPHFFARDLPGLRRVTTERDYLALFDGALDHKAIGEASVTYLFSREAIGNIHAYNPKTKIIVMLRNPVDLVYAYHAQLLFILHENVPSFPRAWGLQEARRKGRRIAATCWEPKTLQYRELGLLGSQVERLLGVFPRQQVLFLLIDDLKRDARAVYRSTLAFLGLPDDHREQFPVVNPNERHRSHRLARILSHHPPTAARWLEDGFLRLGIPRAFLDRVKNKLRRMNKVEGRRERLAASFRAKLHSEFADDIGLLSKLIGRDLDSWLES